MYTLYSLPDAFCFNAGLKHCSEKGWPDKADTFLQSEGTLWRLILIQENFLRN